MPVSLLIFDLDGTLVDTSEDIRNALNHAFEPLGRPPLTLDETIGLVGEGITRLIEKVAGEGADPALVVSIREGFLKHYTEHLVDNSRPYPGVAETLEKLCGIKKAVLSNKREDLSRLLLERLGLASHFDLIAGGDSAPERKPSPEAVRHVLRATGVPADRALLIGDSRFDIEAARGAGVRSIAVTYGYRPRHLLTDADFMVDDIRQVPPLLTTGLNLIERRREERFPVPEFFGSYVQMKVRIAGELYPVRLLDFSEHGFRVASPVPFDKGSAREFSISAPRSLSKEIALRSVVHYCHEEHDSFITGCEITSVEDELWFRIFQNTLKFITDRAGNVF